MKYEWNLFILVAVAFILIVSFQILQPGIDVNYDEDEKNRVVTSASSENKKVLKILEEKYMLKSEYCRAGEDPWTIAANWVSDREVHPENTPEMGCVLHSLKTSKILSADVGYKGTQLKISLELEGGQKVAFKPKMFERDYIQNSIQSGWDRHNGEIAAFHLGRVLEFRRTPLAVGRRINLQLEIIPVASEKLLKTFYTKDGSQCFYGECYYCKDKTSGVCADGDILEGAVILWLPDKYPLVQHVNPWIRSYKPGKRKRWEYDRNYCRDVLQIQQYKEGPRLMDLIDSTVLDYLIGNGDRHHYETLGNTDTSMILLLDNGKSFGNPDEDELTILAPLYQCCKIRESTWQTLLILQNGLLSKIMWTLLSQDSISPVLYDKYYPALDRRLQNILNEVKKCIATKSLQNVIVTDR